MLTYEPFLFPGRCSCGDIGGPAWLGWSDKQCRTDECVLSWQEEKAEVSVLSPYKGAIGGRGVYRQETMDVFDLSVVQFYRPLQER